MAGFATGSTAFGAQAHRREMRSALCRAKSELYEAKFRAEESKDQMATRISEVYLLAERLWIDAKLDEDTRLQAIDAPMVAEYGPRIRKSD